MNALQIAIQNIESSIVANGNEEITANVLRPLLVELATATESITGDLINLNTGVKTNLVAAINNLKSISDNLKGVVVFSGSVDPNLGPITGGASPKPGNFYARYNGSTLLSFWIYNGYDWVEIKQFKGYEVANLPPGNIGDTAYVTDADSPTYLGVAVGGGSTICKVFHNGSNWITQ